MDDESLLETLDDLLRTLGEVVARHGGAAPSGPASAEAAARAAVELAGRLDARSLSLKGLSEELARAWDEPGPRGRLRIRGGRGEVALDYAAPLHAPFADALVRLAGAEAPGRGRVTWPFVAAAPELELRVHVGEGALGPDVFSWGLDRAAQASLRSLRDLGLEDDVAARLEARLADPSQLYQHPIVVAGARGAGRTGTFRAILGALDDPGQNTIYIAEDVGVPLPWVHAIAVGPEITSAQALRASLRQDPDVIVIEAPLDDLQLVVQAALTGHGVILALDAEGPAEALARLQAAYPPGALGEGALVVQPPPG